jgi:hypothetical protein
MFACAGAVYVDSDTGLESMSSAEAGARAEAGGRADADLLRNEVCRLKNDKLDLLKQNIVSTYNSRFIPNIPSPYSIDVSYHIQGRKRECYSFVLSRTPHDKYKTN